MLATFKNIWKKYKIPLLLSLLGLLYLLISLGQNALWDFDEAQYATVARNIIRNNDWFTLSWTGGPWLLKPPLFFWLMAGSMKILGFSEFAARLPSAIAASGTLFFTYLIAQKFIQDELWRIASVLVLFSTPQFLNLAQSGMTDMSLTFFITAAIWAGLSIFKQPDKTLNYLLLGLFVGGAVMTKSIVGLFPVMILGGQVVLTRSWAKLRWEGILGGVAVFAVVILPWHLAMYLQHGSAFLDTYLLNELFRRATTAVQGHPAPFWWYLEVLLNGFKPWIYLLPLAALLIISQVLKNKDLLILYLWPIFVVGVFSLSVDKLAWYILPIYPALAILIAKFFEHLKEMSAEGQKFLAISYVAALTLGYNPFTFKERVLLLALFYFLLGLGYLLYRRVESWFAFLPGRLVFGGGMMGVVVLNLVLHSGPTPANNNLARVCREVSLSSQSTLYITQDFYYQAPIFYCDIKRVKRISREKVATLPLRRGEQIYVLTKKDLLGQIKALGNFEIAAKSGDVILLSNKERSQK